MVKPWDMECCKVAAQSDPKPFLYSPRATTMKQVSQPCRGENFELTAKHVDSPSRYVKEQHDA